MLYPPGDNIPNFRPRPAAIVLRDRNANNLVPSGYPQTMPRTPDGLIPLVELDPGLEAPLYEQLFDGLVRLIRSGRVVPGTRLPASRTLADDLEVSRTTVLEAFRELKSQGYIESRVGDGTYVRSPLPEAAIRATNGKPVGFGAHGAGTADESSPGAEEEPLRMSRRGAQLQAVGSTGLPRDRVRPFLPGVPALAEFPHRQWWSGLVPSMEEIDPDFLHYPDPPGHRSLRTAIAEQLQASRGVRCTADQVVITTGSQQALGLLARLLLDPGDPAWIEDPGYVGARRALQAADARLVPVPVDDEGIDVEVGGAREPNPSIIYVTPSHQFPLGVTMSEARRRRLLEWCDGRDVWIVEDDYDGEYRFEGRPLPALQGLSASSRVVYVGTLSKMLFPALRLGYVVLPDSLVEPLVAVRTALEEAPSPVLQLAAAEFMTGGDFNRHLRRMRALYEERRNALLTALERACGDLVDPQPAGAGMHLSVLLPDEIDATAVSRACATRGVTALTISAFALDRPSAPNGLVLGFAGYTPGEIRHAAHRLCEEIRRREPE